MSIRIVCFGDSNTWGFDPVSKDRYPENVRWTGVLSKRLGAGYKIIEEGQNGRTIGMDDPCEGEKNGMNMIVPVMESQKPFDLLIVMLGTNDLKQKFSLSAMDVAGEMQIMLEKINNYIRYHMAENPKVLLISPVHVGETITDSWLAESYGSTKACTVSAQLSRYYKYLARKYSCDFLDASTVAEPSREDAIHLMPEAHKALADAIEAYIRNSFETGSNT